MTDKKEASPADLRTVLDRIQQKLRDAKEQEPQVGHNIWDEFKKPEPEPEDRSDG